MACHSQSLPCEWLLKTPCQKKLLLSGQGWVTFSANFFATILIVQEDFRAMFSRWFRWRGINQLGKQKARERRNSFERNVPNSCQKLALDFNLLNAAGPWSFYFSFTRLKAIMLSWVLTGHTVCRWLVTFYVLVNHHNLLLMDINDLIYFHNKNIAMWIKDCPSDPWNSC